MNSYKNLDTIKTITNIKNSIPAKVLSSHSDIDNLLIQADWIIKNDDLSGEERNNKLKEIQNKILELLKNPLKLKKLADELKEEWGNIYQEFKTSIIKIAPELQEKFDEYESWSVDTKAKLKLWTDNLKWVDLSKNVLTKTEDWFTTEAWNDTRKISIQWNDYKFDATLQNEDELEELDYLEWDLKSQLKPLNALIVSALNIIGYIDDAILKNIDIKEIKDTIKSEFPELYSELHLENIDSLAQLKQAFVSFLKEKEEEKEEKIKEFKKKINLLIQKNKKAASEKDEKVKAILSFLNKIWFDLLPQSATDWLIAQINAKSQAYWLDKPIDLINWELWFNSFWEKPEVKFTTLFSKILWLKWEDELDYYKIQRNFYGLKLEKNKPWIDWLRVYIDTEFKVNWVFKEDKLLKNLNAK